MTKKTIPTEKFKLLTEINLSKQCIQELTQLTTVMGPGSTINFTLSANEIQVLILGEKYVILELQLKNSALTDSNAKNEENNGVARLKRTAQRALQLLRLATGATLSIFLIIPLVLIIVVPTLVLSLTFAVVCFPIFVLSTPFIWFFASKNNKNSTEQKISDTLENETALLCTLQEAPNDRNEKTISKKNSNDNDIDALESPIKIYPSFFNEKSSKLPDDSQNQPASASISKSL